MIDENRSNQDNTPRKADKVKQMMATQLSWLEHNTHNVGVASSNLAVATKFAGLAKLVDAPDLGSGAERCVGSSPSSRTIYQLSVKQQLGYRQAVRHRVLISASLGSNPSTPAILFSLISFKQKMRLNLTALCSIRQLLFATNFKCLYIKEKPPCGDLSY